MDRSGIAIIIPAYNEEATIENVVQRARGHGLVIVVSDGSQDQTAKRAEEVGATVVTHAQNLGYDKALQSGFQKAFDLNCHYAITMDADGQHDPEKIKEYIGYLCDSFDLVLGIRDKKQRVSERIFGFVTQWLYGVHDPLCGMKGYCMDLYRQLGHFDSYRSIGTELALFGVKNHCRYKQVEVRTSEREGYSRFGKRIVVNYKILRALVMSFIKIRCRR